MLLLINILGHGVRLQFSVFSNSPMHGFPPFIDGWMTWRVNVFTAFVPHVVLQGLSIHGPSLQSTTKINYLRCHWTLWNMRFIACNNKKFLKNSYQDKVALSIFQWSWMIHCKGLHRIWHLVIFSVSLFWKSFRMLRCIEILTKDSTCNQLKMVIKSLTTVKKDQWLCQIKLSC